MSIPSQHPRAKEHDRVAQLLIDTWEKAENAKVNVSYIATFVDMAKVIVAEMDALRASDDESLEMCRRARERARALQVELDEVSRIGMSNKQLTKAVETAKYYLGGGDSPPLFTETTVVIAKGLIVCEEALQGARDRMAAYAKIETIVLELKKEG